MRSRASLRVVSFLLSAVLLYATTGFSHMTAAEPAPCMSDTESDVTNLQLAVRALSMLLTDPVALSVLGGLMAKLDAALGAARTSQPETACRETASVVAALEEIEVRPSGGTTGTTNDETVGVSS